MPNPETVQAVVGASLETWKRQLLDLTRRNRALNFRPLKVSTIAVVDEQPAEVFRLVYDEERTLTFVPAPPGRDTPRSLTGDEPATATTGLDDDPFDEDEHTAAGEAFEPYATTDLADRHVDTRLQTTLEPEALDKSLRRIEEQARLSLEEQGVNTLYLALGLLHYTDAPGSGEILRAPIVLLPVTLRRESARSPFVLSAGDDEPMVNPALAEFLRRQYSVALPDLASLSAPTPAGSTPPGPESDSPSLQDLFLEIKARLAQVPAASQTPAWSVTSDIHLGLFSFQKLVMYKDLEANAPAVTSHRLVQQLVTRRGSVPGGGLGLPDDVRDVRLDDAYPPERGAHVVDADGSQQRALAAADRGYDLVVEGPPGTGKSQTITNLVAQALHAGRSVLFVAEKMAALDVVHQRLQQAGLGEFCLELHSTRASKREVIRSIGAALDASLRPAAAPGDAATRLPDARESLGQYVTAVHEPFAAVGLSPYAAYGELARVIDGARIDWAGGEPEQISRPALDLAVARLEALAATAAAAGDESNHPWRDTRRTFYPQDQLDAIVDTARDGAARIAAVRDASREATASLGLDVVQVLDDDARVREVSDLLRTSPGASVALLSNPEWDVVPTDATSLIARLQDLRRLEHEVAARFAPEALLTDHAGDIAYVEERSGFVSSLVWWLDGRQRAIRARWKAIRLPGYAPSMAAQAHDLKSVVALRGASEAVTAGDDRGRALFGPHWHGVSTDAGSLASFAAWVAALRAAHARAPLSPRTIELAAAGHADVTPAEALLRAMDDVRQSATRLEELVHWRDDRPALHDLTLDDMAARLQAIAGSSALAARWGALVAARADVRESVAAATPALVETGRVSYADLPRAFLRSFWFAWLARAVEARPPLARFQALTHEQRIREFRDLDRRILDDNRARLVGSLRARVQSRLREEGVDAAMPVLRREMAKQRNHRPIRETLRLADAAVRAIKPVFLMSPLSVAQFTPGSAPTFDLVVFDEASQLPPEDAVGAIVRGAQLVVVGDPKQLPPTSFFAAQRPVSSEPDDESGLGVPDAESILEAFMGCGVPMSRLKWHYRSAHESLISFSNVSFYDGDLLTFPSVDAGSDALGLRFEHVADGVYEGKGLNLAEARRVSDAVVSFAREQLAAARDGRRPLSLGVGTFNVRQQLAIQDLLEERRREDPAIELFFDRNRHEPFFVKNLENIQGDERDVVFLSVTYAKGRDGRLRQNFGPLNGDNGWRRLNVITTRARQAMRVYASMRAGDIHEGQSKGGPLLKAFLEYAESGRLDHPAAMASSGSESPFEGEVLRDLARRGHLVAPQVGVAGYRIDIGVRDPDAPGRFLLGIECDGLAYHASETARDRDRLRQQVLEARGWTIVRLWSTDWFKDRAGQADRLEAAIRDARARRRDAPRAPIADVPAATPAPAAPVRQEAAHLQERETAMREATTAAAETYRKATAPGDLPGGGVMACDVRRLAAIVAAVVDAESPVHEDEAVARIAGFWGQRSGSRIRAQVLAAAADAGAAGSIERRGAFLWAPHRQARARRSADADIPVDRIAPEEFQAAMRAVLADGRTLPRDALVAETRRLIGFERTGQMLSQAIEQAIDALVGAGEIGEGSSGYRLLT